MFRDGKARAPKAIKVEHVGMNHPLHGCEETRNGANVKRVPPEVMHFLISTGCFDAEAIAYFKIFVE